MKVSSISVFNVTNNIHSSRVWQNIFDVYIKQPNMHAINVPFDLDIWPVLEHISDVNMKVLSMIVISVTSNFHLNTISKLTFSLHTKVLKLRIKTNQTKCTVGSDDVNKINFNSLNNYVSYVSSHKRTRNRSVACEMLVV